MTALDPHVVRELATDKILDDARRAEDVGAAVIGHFGPDALTKHEYGAYCTAIREAIATATITAEWPGTVAAATTAGEFQIRAVFDPIDSGDRWVAVQHEPCEAFILGDGPDDPDEFDAGVLLERIAAHRCKPCECGCVPGQPCACGLEDCECIGSCRVCDTADDHAAHEIITVDVDGAPVTASIHGSKPLDAEGREAMAEIVRAAQRKHLADLRAEREARDEDVRAVARVLELYAAIPYQGLHELELSGAAVELNERFADRIEEVRQRDAEGPVSTG